MPERVTKEEKIVELAILKAKQILQEAEHLGTLELDEPLTGEDEKVKRPKKNPSEVPLPKTSNVEGKEDKVSKAEFDLLCDEILKTMFVEGGAGQRMSDEMSGQRNAMNELLSELSRKYSTAPPDQQRMLTTKIKSIIGMLKDTRDLPSQDTDRRPSERRF